VYEERVNVAPFVTFFISVNVAFESAVKLVHGVPRTVMTFAATVATTALTLSEPATEAPSLMTSPTLTPCVVRKLNRSRRASACSGP
jgi:hypothetical protein